VNLYIAEVRVLYVGHGTMEVKFRDRLDRNPRLKKWIGMERGSTQSELRYKKNE
jgi:hypothetical protein